MSGLHGEFLNLEEGLVQNQSILSQKAINEVQELSKILQQKQDTVSIVHAIGLSNNHDVRLLNKLVLSGSECGQYSFAKKVSKLSEQMQRCLAKLVGAVG